MFPSNRGSRQVDKHIRELDTELNQFEIEHAAGLTDPRHEKRGRRRDLQSESERLEDMYVLCFWPPRGLLVCVCVFSSSLVHGLTCALPPSPFLFPARPSVY